MDVTKIGRFSKQEFEELQVAGKALANAATALEAKEIDELSEESLELISALEAVIARIKPASEPIGEAA